MPVIEIGNVNWLSPDHLFVLREFSADLEEVLLDYRATLKAYALAYSQRETGTKRVNDARRAQTEAIANAVEAGLTPEDIFDRHGTVAVMDNVFAVKVADAYEKLAKYQEKTLIGILKRRSTKILAWLEEQTFNPDAAHALQTVKDLKR